MSLFTEALNTQARLKAGFLGFQGAGKTYTATRLMIGLMQHMRQNKIAGSEKPLFFLDTETGSDWVRRLIEEAGIKLMQFKSRAFKDLVPAVREAEENGSGLIIDSVSHFWREFTEAYMRRKNRSRLEFQDWNFLKPEWGKFTDAFVNSNLHICICGRAGFEYDYFEDEQGKKQLEKTGIKMKAETEFGYEPSLLVLMERAVNLETKQVEREAHVLKDRAALLDGQTFKFTAKDKPDTVFKAFASHIESLNIAGKQLGVDLSRTSEEMIDASEGPQKTTWKYEQEQKEIVLEKVQSLFAVHGLSAQSKDGKAEIVRLINKHFGTTSWKELEGYPLKSLKEGFASLEFDMGESSGPQPPTPPAILPSGEAAEAAGPYITADDVLALELACTDAGVPVDALKAAAKVERLAMMLAADLERAKAWIARKAKRKTA